MKLVPVHPVEPVKPVVVDFATMMIVVELSGFGVEETWCRDGTSEGRSGSNTGQRLHQLGRVTSCFASKPCRPSSINRNSSLKLSVTLTSF